MCANWKCFSVMSVGLAVLGLVNAITIDNHLVTTKNDCYERLALGQRLDPRDVTRALSARTAADCQAACSEEDQRCLSLSFGISPKGNGTCELSYAPVRETADLQPIGTVRDPDFDLYIKKVDCKLNIPKEPPASDVQKPTYAVAVLDRPSSGINHGYEVQEHSPRPPPRRPTPRPPDVFVFHGDRPGDHNAYQNYYDVPRPFPLPYGSNRDRPSGMPALDYPQDDRYYYGMTRPVLDMDRFRPSFNDYYGQRRPYDNRRPIDDKPYNYDVNRNRPHRPDIFNPNNPNVYDDKPFNQPGPESNRRNPYIPEYDNARPIAYEPNRRPYKPNREPNYPIRPPVVDYESNRRPVSNTQYNDPYSPEHMISRPYMPYGPNHNDNGLLYGPNNNDKRPYGPYLPDNTHYYDRPSEYDRNKPYGSNNDEFKPYLDPQYGKRPENKPYGPSNDRFRPYLDPQDGKRPSNNPYNSNSEKRKPDPDNPNYKGEWDRVGGGSGNEQPKRKPQQSAAGYQPMAQDSNKTGQGGTVTSIITQIVEHAAPPLKSTQKK